VPGVAVVSSQVVVVTPLPTMVKLPLGEVLR
jgi:hypothetical protein